MYPHRFLLTGHHHHRLHQLRHHRLRRHQWHTRYLPAVQQFMEIFTRPTVGPHYCNVTSNTLKHYSMINKKTKLSAQYFPNILLFVISSVMCLIGPMVVHRFKARPVIPKTVRHNPPLD